MARQPFRYRETKYGFEYGPVEVERVTSYEEKRGMGVLVWLKTKQGALEIRVTPAGFFRVNGVPTKAEKGK